jgi:hypothetical protein
MYLVEGWAEKIRLANKSGLKFKNNVLECLAGVDKHCFMDGFKFCIRTWVPLSNSASHERFAPVIVPQGWR